MEVDGEVEHSFLVRCALWTLEVAMPLGEVCGERRSRDIIQRTARTAKGGKNNTNFDIKIFIDVYINE
jgi:predicted lipid carrier protein YhbT